MSYISLLHIFYRDNNMRPRQNPAGRRFMVQWFLFIVDCYQNRFLDMHYANWIPTFSEAWNYVITSNWWIEIRFRGFQMSLWNRNKFYFPEHISQPKMCQFFALLRYIFFFLWIASKIDFVVTNWSIFSLLDFSRTETILRKASSIAQIN